jgi:hypothetical protein
MYLSRSYVLNVQCRKASNFFYQSFLFLTTSCFWQNIYIFGVLSKSLRKHYVFYNRKWLKSADLLSRWKTRIKSFLNNRIVAKIVLFCSSMCFTECTETTSCSFHIYARQQSINLLIIIIRFLSLVYLYWK